LTQESETSLHVCHVVLTLDVGGLERVVIDLCRQGQTLGQQVSILCIQKPGALAHAAEALGVPVACSGKPAGFRPDFIPVIADLFRTLRPDVVHTHQIGALVYAGPAARRARVPLTVHTEHGKHYATSWKRRMLGRVAARYARRFFTVSTDIGHEVRDCRIVSPSRIVHVPNGIDTSRFDVREDVAELRREFGLSPDQPVIGTVGRLAGVKRHDVLLQAFARLHHRSAQLLIAGGGPLQHELGGLADGLGISDRVKFAGYLDRPERALAAMDVFALTSQSEGMPLAILEAWAAGKPVVASRVGGVPELVDDGRTGLLFESGDSETLAGLLDRLLVDRALGHTLGSAGQTLARNRFDTRAMAETYRRHYQLLLRTSKEGHACAFSS
jgi:glycosyltransferase involved in cell wall biosynthesis